MKASKHVLALFALVALQTGESALPVVLWHGMGDSCCFSFSMGAIKSVIEDTIPGVYVYSVRLGNNVFEDVERSYLGNADEQVKEVCEVLARDERLKGGFNAIGFSQGAQLLRAVMQRCSIPSVATYVSVGGQQQGVFGIPKCFVPQHKYCEYIRRVLKYGAYSKLVQENLVQASYWHDPLQEENYKRKSILIAEINNEAHQNETYKLRLQSLKKMVLVKFNGDTMVVPRESQWFGFYEPGQDEKVLNITETDVYKNDALGLRQLLETRRMDFLELPGDHLQFTEEWFVDNIIKRYLL